MAGLQIPNPSITSGAFASMLAFSSDNYTITAISGHPIAGVGGGGTPVDGYWRPSVNTDGDISWAWSLESTSTVPATANIKGPQGIQGETGPRGPSGTNGKDAPIPEFQINSSNAHWEWKYTNESDWTDLNVVASGTVGPQGIQGPSGSKGDTGAKGADATPLTADTTTIAGGTQVTISYTSGGDPLAQFNVLSGAQGASGQKGADGKNGYSPTVSTTTTATGDRTGTVLTFVYGDEGGQTTSYTAWNGIDGQGATVNLIEGDGIQITHETGTTNYTIGVSADYATKTYVDTASAEALSQAKTWVEQQSYLPTSGGTVSGQLTISGSTFNNNLRLQRGNAEGFIGLAGNGAITLKNVIPNSTSQIEFLTSDNKTFDITVKDNSQTPLPTGKLYVMSAHSFADASATSANWANDGMLHIILDS